MFFPFVAHKGDKSVQMKNIAKWWKTIISVLVGAVYFIICFFPLRALMNYHEEHHMFRWDSYYLKEQLASWEGAGEYLNSFIMQFFYIGWLGAVIVALLMMGIQGFTWWLMCRVRLSKAWLFPLSFVPCTLLFYYSFVPERYRQEAEFREVIEYDYLVRTQQWKAITNKPETEQPATDLGVWGTNFALAKCGQLSDFMFFFRQLGTNSLFDDGQQKEVLAYYSLSDIFLQLGMVNNAERMAFDAKQYIPQNHKSGRLYRRLAETNLINGNYTIAKKYLRILKSTLFYGQWARRFLEHIDDEEYISKAFAWQRSIRQSSGRELISPDKGELLLSLVQQNKENSLAWDYLLAYALLQRNLDKVARYMQIYQEAGYERVPRAVQECLIGNRLLGKEEHPHIEFKVDENVEMLTEAYFHTIESKQDLNNRELNGPPFSHTYWHYQMQAIQKRQTP